jgi:hypothetical protein
VCRLFDGVWGVGLGCGVCVRYVMGCGGGGVGCGVWGLGVWDWSCG